MASVQCVQPVEATASVKDNDNHDQHHDKANTGHETEKVHCDGKASTDQHQGEHKSSSSHGYATTYHGKTEKKTKDKKEKKGKKEKKDKKCHEKEHKKEKKCKDGKSGHSSSDSD